jgi:hypothetical protein
MGQPLEGGDCVDAKGNAAWIFRYRSPVSGKERYYASMPNRHQNSAAADRRLSEPIRPVIILVENAELPG